MKENEKLSEVEGEHNVKEEGEWSAGGEEAMVWGGGHKGAKGKGGGRTAKEREGK